MMSLRNQIATSCRALVLVVLGLHLAGCAAPRPPEAAKSSQPTKTYQMRGEIMGIDAAGHTATIKHEDIPGFMKAMTMGYPVKDPAELSKLSVGEPITATVYENGDDFWVGNFQKAAPAPKP